MKKIMLLISCLLVAAINSNAQTADVVSDPKKLLEALKKDKFEVDVNAKAVILYREQSSILDERGYIENTYELSAKILSDVAAQDLSLINIPKGEYSMVYGVSGDTYNLENGEIVKQSMEKKEVKSEKIVEDFNVIKFNLPAVKKGSIIHYRYKLKIPVLVFVPDYYLQMNYPILLQYYYLRVPGYIKFQKVERINIPLTNITYKKMLDTCQAGIWTESYGTNGTLLTWVRRNESAFNSEPFMASEDNYKERIKIQLTSVLMNNGTSINFSTNWNEYTKKYYYENASYTGSVFKNNGFFDDKIDELTSSLSTNVEKATAIYKFVRDSFTIKSRDKEFNLKAVYNNRWGSSKDINLVLLAMLRRAKFECNPVLVSTTSNERLNPVYPEAGNVNQILAQIVIDKKTYYLNASQKNLPFGVILPESYNGFSQVISETPWSIQLEPNDCKEKSASIYNILPTDTKGVLAINVETRLGNYEAYQFREAMQNDTSKIRKDIINNLKKGSLDVALTNLEVSNLNNPELPLKIHYEGKITLDSEEKTTYFNPFLDPFFTENPFPALVRKYPIEMGYLTDKNYIINIKLPEGYEIDDFAKSKTYKYDEAGTLVFNNIWNFNEATKTLSIKSRLQTNETYFLSSTYDNLKNFYDKIIEEQQQKIVIKNTTLN